MNHHTKTIAFLLLSQCNSMAFSASPFDPQNFPMIELDLKRYWHHISDECGNKRFVRIPTLPNKEQREEYESKLQQQSIANLTLLRSRMQQINNDSKTPLDTYRSYASIQSINKMLKQKEAQKPPLQTVVIHHHIIPRPLVRMLYAVPAVAVQPVVQATPANQDFHSIMKPLDRS